MQMLWTLVTLR